MTGIIDIKRAVTDNRVVRFAHYHNSEEKALLFMRKWNTRLEEQNG